MASYYKYKSREGQDQVDWRTITKGITDEITRVKGDRNKKRKDIQDAALVTYENLANKPQGPDVLENKNIASYAAQQEAMAREDLAMLRSGDITLQQYTSRSNTAQGGTKRLFNLSKKYQANVQAQLDSLKPDENGIIQGSGMNAIYKQMVERFADPSNSMYYVDPETRESFLAIVTDKEGDDVVKINDKAYSLMGVAAAEDIILRNDARYQSNSVSTLLKDEVGAFIKVLRQGDVETKEDAYARMFDGKELTADGKAIMSQIKATFASDNDYSSMLFDTLGYVPVAENENGEGFTNLQTKEIIDELPDNSFLVKTVNGRQVPQIDDTLKDAAHRGVLAQIKSKLDIKETAMKDMRGEEEKLALAERRVDDAEARTRLQALRDKKNTSKSGDVIFADPNEAFETYIVADDKLEKNAKGVVVGVNADLLSDKTNNTNNQEDASKQVIAPLVAKFGDLGFSFTLDNTSDFFTVVGPSGGEGVRIDYDEQESDALEEYQRLMTFIRGEFDNETVLESKYSVIGYDRFGPGAVEVNASGVPIRNGVNYGDK